MFFRNFGIIPHTEMLLMLFHQDDQDCLLLFKHKSKEFETASFSSLIYCNVIEEDKVLYLIIFSQHLCLWSSKSRIQMLSEQYSHLWVIDFILFSTALEIIKVGIIKEHFWGQYFTFSHHSNQISWDQQLVILTFSLTSVQIRHSGLKSFKRDCSFLPQEIVLKLEVFLLSKKSAAFSFSQTQFPIFNIFSDFRNLISIWDV